MPYDHNQVEVPESFVALYLRPGQLTPSATREVVTRRYELCEDVAASLEELAGALNNDRGIPEADVLRQCHLGLLEESSGLSDAEAAWVVQRLAERRSWTCPAELAGRPTSG